MVRGERGADDDAFISALLKAGALARSPPVARSGPRSDPVRVRRLMHPPPPALDPETPIGDAERLFHACGLEWLPVVEGGRFVGFLRHGDVTRALLRIGSSDEPPALSDLVRGD